MSSFSVLYIVSDKAGVQNTKSTLPDSPFLSWHVYFVQFISSKFIQLMLKRNRAYVPTGTNTKQ